MIVSGVEEAGRGPVIGPMAMAICSLDEKEMYKLRDLGVKDSKLLTPLKRKTLAEEIRKVCISGIIILSPKEIDSALKDPNMNLNKLEAVTSAKLINSVKTDKVILDCPSNNTKAYEDLVKSMINNDIKVVAENKADANHLIVGAASILAKVRRDEEIKKIKEKIRVDFGSGYPSDPKTIRFLSENWEKYDFFRKTWATYKKISDSKKQKGLKEY